MELLQRKKNLNTLAVEHSIQPNLLRNWNFLIKRALFLMILVKTT